MILLLRTEQVTTFLKAGNHSKTQLNHTLGEMISHISTLKYLKINRRGSGIRMFQVGCFQNSIRGGTGDWKGPPKSLSAVLRNSADDREFFVHFYTASKDWKCRDGIFTLGGCSDWNMKVNDNNNKNKSNFKTG